MLLTTLPKYLQSSLLAVNIKLTFTLDFPEESALSYVTVLGKSYWNIVNKLLGTLQNVVKGSFDFNCSFGSEIIWSLWYLSW